MIIAKQKIPILLILLTLLFGCEGDPGTPGVSRLGNDLFPPTAEIILPIAERPIFERVFVELKVIDDDSVSNVLFLCDGRIDLVNFTPIVPNYQYIWHCAGLTEGLHILQVAAYDRIGRVGLSAGMVLRKESIIQMPAMDTLKYFAISEERNLLDWKLPPDSLSRITGYAVRFSPDRPCKLRRVYTRIKRKVAWESGTLWLEVYNCTDGKPDSLRSRKIITYRSMGDPNDFVNWDMKSYGENGLAMNGEFFVAVVPPTENVRGDTLAIQSDEGLWNNGHGYARIDNNWQEFYGARFRILNPLIYVVVSY